MTDARRSCRGWEPALALYVEGDLPAGEVQPLEAHLAECADCRESLRALRESQAVLHGLADETLEEDALDAVRARVRARLAHRKPHLASVWYWAAAASVVLAVALTVVGLMSRRGERPETRETSAQPPLAVATPALPAVPEIGSTTVPKPAGVRRAAVVRPRASGPTAEEPDVPLTSEEADQLARAIVLLSRIERLDDFKPEADTARDTPPAATVRLATADPNVVIYWQFESNGG